MRVVVVGAGALGAACALHLARAGCEVVVVEREQVAAATTGLAAGLLSLGVMEDLDRRLVVATLAGLQDLRRFAAGDAALLRRPGSPIVARAPREVAHVKGVARDLERLELPHAFLEPSDWARVMAARGIPARADDIAAVLDLPADAWALSTEATNAMMRAARAAGASWRRGTAIGLLRGQGDAVAGVRLSDGEAVPGDRTVLALGAWTRGLLERDGLRLPAQAYTTHAAVLSTPRAARYPILHDHPGHYYLRPEGPHHLLVGDGTNTEPADVESFAPAAEPDFVARLAPRLTHRFAGLADARLVNAWRGVLTGTPDKGALVGAHPDADGLFVATGGNGFGFMRSWALGAVLAAAVANAEVPAPVPRDVVARLDPARFWPNPPAAFPVTEGYSLPPET